MSYKYFYSIHIIGHIDKGKIKIIPVNVKTIIKNYKQIQHNIKYPQD